MKNKTILKAVKIALVACVMLTACIIPTFAETATIPEYNGYIPVGKYVVVSIDGDVPIAFGDAADAFFEYENDGATVLGSYIEFWEGELWLMEPAGELDKPATIGDVIDVFFEFSVTEEQFDAFFHYFTPVGTSTPDTPDTPAPSINIYQTCYDLINTYVFGGTVVSNTYQDLICIAFSAAACIFLMSLPFLLVWIIIKVWF